MVNNWLETNWHVALIIFGTIILYVLIDSFGKRAWITALTQRSRLVGQITNVKTEILQRAETISSVFTKMTKIIVIAIATVMILAELGVNIIPIITGAGIIGIAFGFGTQSLIKDIVAGIFVMVEHQYSKGDEVSLGEVRGKVLHFSLRSTVLQDAAGVEHHIPNGSVVHVANFSKHKAKA